MIEIKYKILRDEIDEIKQYQLDNIPSTIDDITYIEGPNGCGKSTLLNILALAAHGIHKKDLNISLRKKLESLLDISYQKLTFTIKIKNDKLKKEYLIEKTNTETNEINVYEVVKGKKSNFTIERFSSNFNLIYDIPDNPTERLYQLTLDIKHQQHKIGNKVGYLLNHLKSTLGEISKSKDPKKIQEYEKKEKQNIGEHTDLIKKRKRKSDKLRNLKEYTYCKFFMKYNELEESYKQKMLKKKKKKASDQRKSTKLGRDYYQYLNQYETLLDEVQDKYRDVTDKLEHLLTSRNKHHFDLWKNTSIEKSIEQPEFKDTIDIEGNQIKVILQEEKNKIHNMGDIKKNEFIADLIHFLNSYSDSQLIIPGFQKSINEILEMLLKFAKKNQEVMVKFNSIKQTIDDIDYVLDNKQKLRDQYIPKLKKLKVNVKILDSKNQKSEYAKEIENQEKNKSRNYITKKDYYYKRLANLDINEVDIPIIFENMKKFEGDIYNLMDENQLLSLINEMIVDIKSLEEDINRKKENITYLQNEISKLNNLGTHKYFKYLEKLENFENVILALEQKFKSSFDDYITNLIPNNHNDKIPDSPEANKYFENVFKFLASKVKFIRHINKNYEVKKIDLIKNEITTTSKKVIKISDLGTGQGQSAYLRGLLNTNDDRIIIVLFDEIAMMDNKSLKPIYEKLIELYNEKRLLFGIVVQKGNAVKVKSII